MIGVEKRCAKRGEAQEYYRSVVLAYDGEECLIWPFSCAGNGYAQMYRDGQPRVVSRLVCEDAHGAPPSAIHQAAHSCGKGNSGCVAKAHLSWKTPSGNQLDRNSHGTGIRGERHPSAKITEAQVREIRRLKGKEAQTSIAARYGVSRQVVADIHQRRTWAWLSDFPDFTATPSIEKEAA
ncbi:hypothetical protein B9J07_12890 [Sinorhizobium sp. LM21]|uniref:HNH endonuclease n=1 Tax=Sinorhizobium phage phiLM21 TaxID=1524882 RepID=UPI0004E5C1CF|nr:HNH endonuclease [Sinorhizobium phage phiLM21]AII27768.1 HNH endonuclease [Sinorhizobium phage phiLM21]OWZ93532.1 hypothetical protein B9J07_12890 [Sinorhizobium sp. LM21]